MEAMGKACIDAYAFAQAYDFPNCGWFREEALCFNTIPEECLLAEIPAQGSIPDSALGPRLNVPQDLLTAAISTYSCSKLRSRELLAFWLDMG